MSKFSLNARRFGLLLAVPALVAIAPIVAAISSNSDNQAAAAAPKEAQAQKSPVQFNKNGELVRPTGYRKWMYVGTPLTPNDRNNGNAPFPEFHTVYMNPAAYNHYEKTGEFPNGTVLVKELISVGETEASSGNGYFMGEFSGLEVAMKDKRRFKDEPGNWAYFSYGHEYPLRPKAKIQPAASCNDCHDGEADDDWVFTQYYPVLRAAKKSAN